MNSDIQRIPLQISQGCILASIQIELTDEILQQFCQDILENLHTKRAKGVILDVSGIEIMDLEDFYGLRRIMSIAAIMGAETIFTGFQPGVVSSLMDLNADIEGINAVFSLDDALNLMQKIQSAKTVTLTETEEVEDEPSELNLDSCED